MAGSCIAESQISPRNCSIRKSSMAYQHLEDSYTKSNHPLQNGYKDDWTWNHEEDCPCIQLKGPDRKTVVFHPKWSSGIAGVRGLKAINHGKHYWEIHVNEEIFGTSIMFGNGTRKARLFSESYLDLIGEDNQSWGLSHIGLIHHDGKFSEYTEPFKLGNPTTIGILFDGTKGTLTYYKDEIYLGITFSNLGKITDSLYPIISSSAY